MRNDTLQYYDRSAAKEAARYESLAATRLDDVLGRWVPRGSCVLELGCGSGRDARKMAARGAFVTATDGSPAMIAEAERLRKEAVAKAEASGRSESTTAGLRALRFQPLTLPPTVSSGDTASSSGDSSSDRKLRTTEEALAHLGASSPFDAVVAIGVLQHLGDAALYDTALFLDAVLTDTGVLVLAVPENHAGPTAVDPRYYSIEAPLIEIRGFTLTDNKLFRRGWLSPWPSERHLMHKVFAADLFPGPSRFRSSTS